MALFKKALFKKKAKQPSEPVTPVDVKIPGWEKIPYSVLAQEWAKNMGLAEAWDVGSEPVNIVDKLQEVPVKKGKELEAVGRRGWLLLTGYRKCHEEKHSLQLKLAELEKEMDGLLKDNIMLRCHLETVSQKADHYQSVADQAAVRLAQHKYRKRRQVNKMKNEWNPETWDGNIWDSTDTDSAEEAEVESPSKINTVEQACPIVRRRTNGQAVEQEVTQVLEDFTQQDRMGHEFPAIQTQKVSDQPLKAAGYTPNLTSEHQLPTPTIPLLNQPTGNSARVDITSRVPVIELDSPAREQINETFGACGYQHNDPASLKPLDKCLRTIEEQNENCRETTVDRVDAPVAHNTPVTHNTRFRERGVPGNTPSHFIAPIIPFFAVVEHFFALPLLHKCVMIMYPILCVFSIM
ncbi:uncharacterized protein LOC115078152 [Rhinatrema bivittatum]|uniref:uncharacterized protein LOC115078152 n=1 Tax=Rhinatrema bivittatum TaxID=194408 RepID=UPI0011260550|nr:uncharacterized protein LOC115078152 [Rhinatrema bivittatum]